MDFSQTLPRPELLAMVNALSEEKGIEKELVFTALEESMLKVARNQYGYEHDLLVNIDRKTGGIGVRRRLTVIKDDKPTKAMDEEGNPVLDEEGNQIMIPFNEHTEITVEDAQKKDKNLTVGDTIEDYLPPLYLGRMAFQSARQIVLQKIRDAERTRQFQEFEALVGTVVNGTVKRNEYGNVYVDINGRAEGYLKRMELIPREMLHAGDRIRALILEVERTNSGPQIFLSRSHPDFMAKLFEAEVPEVYEGNIQIKAVARDPGSHAKIAVYSEDPSMDPVGTCVGMRGSRIQPIINELQGEKIDVIQWTPDLGEMAIRAITPAKAAKVVVDEETKKIEIAVAADQLSIAIGRRGQNVRLASDLIGCQIDVMSEAEEAEKRNVEIAERLALFTSALDIDEVIARLLLTEGFRTIEEIAYVPAEEFMAIEGFEPELVIELQTRAATYVAKKEKEFEDKKEELHIDESLVNFDGLTKEQKVLLAEKDVKTLDDLADLAGDELVDILSTMSEKEANDIIMKAREHWFEGEEK